MFKPKEDILDPQHWIYKDYRQRIESKDWKVLLMNDEDDRIIFKGIVCKLICKNLEHGVVEVYKLFPDEENN